MTRLPDTPLLPELLAPAGNMTCLHAAVAAGADAVYLGLDEFNARRNADNFTLETLEEACEYAHLRGVSIYVTMNVEILPSELDRALAVAARAWEAGADAFIVQDIGLARELQCSCPQVPVHISTQMNTHNAAGIVAAAQLGARRVTLARELSLAEIAELSALAADLGMEVECFAHGALCVCYSGQCLMSSMIGGRSANRGLCAQACRLPYELHRADREDALPAEGEHLLSPRDLCTIDILPDLAAVGVASLKVEGRMKSPDYVHAVVSVYREVLDTIAIDALSCQPETPLRHPDTSLCHPEASLRQPETSLRQPETSRRQPDTPLCHPERSEGSRALPAQPGKATEAQRARLAEAFSRGFTTAYLEGQRGNNIMSYGRPNNRGVFAGRVTRASEGEAFITPEIDLHADDVLEFWTNRGHFAATVGTAAPAKDGTVRIPIDQRVGKGDRVFRVRNAELAFQDDPFTPRIPVNGKVTLRIGQPAHMQFERAGAHPACPPDQNDVQDGSVGARFIAPAAEGGYKKERSDTTVIGEATGDIIEPARTRAVSEQDVRDHVDRLGNTPFTLETLEVDLDENVGIAFSALHHLRANALSDLQSNMLASWPCNTNADRSPSREGVSELSEAVTNEGEASPALIKEECGLATNPACARASKRGGAAHIYVPLLNFRRGQAQLEGIRQEDPEQAGYPKQCIPVLPTIDHDPVYAERGATRETLMPFDLWDYVREGKPVFADNLGDVLRALEADAHVEVGPHVPATNIATLRALADLGVSRVWLSPELTLGQIADLARETPVPLGLAVAGAQELMITEHCLLMSQGPCNEQCETCPRRSHAHVLRDRKGYDFPVVTDMLGRSHLYNGIELDAVPTLPDLLDIGISAVMVDTTLMSKKEAESAVARAVRALDLAQQERRAVQKRPNTTTGHLFRGVS